METRVVIVGGGLSGLALGFELMKRGVSVKVLEAEDRPGGTIGTGRSGGWQWETGPTGILDREGRLPALAEALGITKEVLPAADAERDRFVYVAGQLWAVRLSPKMLLGGPLTFGGRMRLLWEPFSSRAKQADESIAAFGRRHVGAQAVERLLDPMVTGIYAGDVEQLSLPACFPRMRELEDRSRSLVLGAIAAMRRAKKEGRVAVGARLTSFTTGMQTLTDALARKLGDAVALRSPVRSIARADGGWRLQLEGGALRAESVVLCAPAPVQAQLVAPIDEAAAEALTAIPYAAMSVVHLGYASDDVKVAPRGFGFLASSTEGLPILGSVFPSTIFPGRAPEGGTLFTTMIGGVRAPEAALLDDEALAERARAGLQQALGIAATPKHVRVVRWPRAIPQYTVGHLARVAALEAAEARQPGIYFGGNAIRGVSVADCLKQGEVLAERIASAK